MGVIGSVNWKSVMDKCILSFPGIRVFPAGNVCWKCPPRITSDGNGEIQVQGEEVPMLLNFYKDPLTKAYSRLYLDNFVTNLEGSDGVAFIDVHRFKKINDAYGHPWEIRCW